MASFTNFLINTLRSVCDGLHPYIGFGAKAPAYIYMSRRLERHITEYVAFNSVGGWAPSHTHKGEAGTSSQYIVK